MKKAPRFGARLSCIARRKGSGGGAYLPQFEQSEAPRFTEAGFFTGFEELQFLQFDCFIALPPKAMMCGIGRIIPTEGFSTLSRSNGRRTLAHNKGMNTRKERNTNATDKMIQGNKDEAESTLRLWGKKARKHILPNGKKPK